MKVTVTEARLNDLVYMALKRYFFQPEFGSGPRQCDIRVCMDMAAPERLKGRGVEVAILRPDEKAGVSHATQYAIDTDTVLEEALEYLNDHWRAGIGPATVAEIKADWDGAVVPAVMLVPEADCGIELRVQ